MSALVFFVIAAAFTLPIENVSATGATTFYGAPSLPATSVESPPATIDAVVFLDAAYETGMVEKIKQVAGVSSVYYAEPLFFFTSDENGKEMEHKWNYVVVGEGLNSSEAQDNLISDVGGLDFVKTYAGYRLTSGGKGGLSAAVLNKVMKTADPSQFIKRPLRPASPKPDCTNMRMAKGERVKLIQMFRYKKGKDIDEIKKRATLEWLLKIFPAMKGSYDYAGLVSQHYSPVPIVWEQFEVTDWVDLDTLCEWSSSAFAQEWSRKSYPLLGAGIGIAVEV